MKRIAQAVLPLVLLALLLGACRGQSVVTCKPNQGYDHKLGKCYDCPPGTKAHHGSATCVPVAETDTRPEGDVTGPLPSDVKDTREEPEDVPPADEVADAADSADVAPKDVIPAGTVGASCSLDADCLEGLSCFDWPGGYCVQMNCADNEVCGEGGACLPLLANGQACFDACQTDADCRQGYGCKGIPTAQGQALRVCHPVAPDEKSLGSVCDGHAECAGDLACVKLGPQAMCSTAGCSSFDPCPDGTACAVWGNLTLCLPECEGNVECAAMASEAFTCQDMETVEEEEVSVCSPAQQGLPVGELCYFSTECATGYCHLLITGKCTGLDASECGTDTDCDEGLCLPDRSIQKGVCSAPCGPGETCPSGALCVMTGEGAACMDACDQYGLPCGPDGFNMLCSYGTLHYPVAPSGKYACAKSLAGEGGAACDDDGDCASGVCYGAALPDGGYCATTCLTDNECPFGTECQTGTLVEGQTYCTRLCFHNVDCTPGFVCKNTFYSEKACLLDE